MALFTNIKELIKKGDPSEMPPATLASFCFLFATAALFLLFSNLLITSLVFIANGHIVPIIAWISIVLTAIFVFFYAKANFKKYILWSIMALVAVCAIFAISILVSERFYDISYDGQTYQQEGVIQLEGGWNPVYQYLSPGLIGGEQKWINYYPKASWINEGYIYLLTHKEQAGKALNIVLIAISIALLYTALTDTEIVGKFNALLLSIIVGCNPVSICQALTFYIDGQLMSLFLCIAATFLIMYAGKRRLSSAPLFFAIPIFVNLKFTAALDALALIAAFMLAAWLKRNEPLLAKVFFVGATALIIGGLVIGSNSYIVNIVRYKTPFYPLLGPGAIDLKPYNVPGNFINRNSAEILFLSFFSQSGGIKGAGTTSSYKIPFTWSTNELAAFHYPDADEGGFGPLFGGAIIISFLILAGFYLAARKSDAEERRKFWMAFWIIAFVIALSVINPISSLARYVPQAYLIAIIPIVLLLSTKKISARTVGYLAAALLVFNSYLIANASISYNLKTSAEIAAELKTLAAQSQAQPIIVHFNEFKSTRIMLDEAGVRYTWTNDPNACPPPASFQDVLPENTTEFCVN